MLLTDKLRDTIEDLYKSFASYHLRSNSGACPDCHSDFDEQRLHTKPLRKLTQEDLWLYAMDALYTWGDENDFKHFLPRIFELLALSHEGPIGFVDPAQVFTKLLYESHCSSSWRYWPSPEQEAIKDYFRAVWDAAINSESEDLRFSSAHDWICGIAQAEDDLSPYLGHWLLAPSLNAHRNLAALVRRDLSYTKRSTGYWAGHEQQWEQVVAWLRRPDVREKLASAVEKWGDSPFGGELLDAAVMLP